jgi:hypothetical protein
MDELRPPAVGEADVRALARLAGIEVDAADVAGVAAVLDSVATSVAGFSELALDEIPPAPVFAAEWRG